MIVITTMKKFAIGFGILIVLAIVIGSNDFREKHVFNTYYGAIDTDTMVAIQDDDGEDCYIVNSWKMDSAVSDGMGLEEMYHVIYYKPSKDVYFTMMFGSDGGKSAKIYFNPMTGATDSIR